MPYLTPEEMPESATCRTLLIPSSSEWLAIVSGALTELSKEWNWEQSDGGISVQDALSAVNTMLTTYYDGCSDCYLPGGSPLFRLNPNGQIEQLVGGEWVEPQGEYELPPTPPRSEPTPAERKCLAALNAANAFEQLYEEISDAYNEGLTLQEWTNALVAVLIGILGTVFGLVILPLITIGAIIVGIIYETLEFVGADLWDEEFTAKLVCMLYECASDNDATDVVSFDYNCFMEKLASAVNVLDPTTAEIRLFGQISFILSFLGAQSLDAMGATTEITEGECEDCGWCVTYDFTAGTHDFAPEIPGLGTWVSGEGWTTELFEESPGVYNATDFSIVRDFTGITIDQVIAGVRNAIPGSFVDAPPDSWVIGLYNAGVVLDPEAEPEGDFELSYDGVLPLGILQVFTRMGYANVPGDPGGEATLSYITLRGHGTKPTGGEDC